MTRWRHSMAIALIAGTVHLLIADGAVAAKTGGTGEDETAVVREQMAELGSGAEVKLELKGGGKLKGEVGELGEDGFGLQQSGRGSRTIGYGEVARVKLAKLSYRAKGQPDGQAVRRVVWSLGAGKHVAVRTVGGTTYRGHLRKIGREEFTLLPDRATRETTIAYGEVTQVGKNLTAGGTIAVLAGVLAAVVIVAMFLNKDETPKVQI